MWPSPSGAFDAAVEGGGIVSIRISLLNNAVFPPTTTSSVNTGLSTSLTNSSVQVDRDSQVHRTCTLDLTTDNTFFSQANFGVLTHKEWKVERGFIISGSPQYVPLGVFHTKTFQEEYSGGQRTVRIQGEDRSATCAATRFKRPYTVSAGTPYPTAIANLVTASVAGKFAYSSSIGANADVTPRLVFSEDESPWAKLKELAEGISQSCHFLADGSFRSVAIQDDWSGAAEVFTLNTAGGAGADVLMAPAGTEQDLDTVVTGVIVRGSAPWLLSPVYGEAYDMDPASPTYSAGPLGQIPLVIENAIITTSTQADALALSMLTKKIGIVQTITTGSLVVPGLEAGDILHIIDAFAGINAEYVSDSFDVPLSFDRTMTINAKKRRVPPIAP